ncbi:hypothetical protein QIT55_gp51 [Nitrosopumilus spindle-shaped virus]|uniref:Uncharacterized protein n=1 Tax=Nitrosopumilus spindle-shaped virus 1 TaxID=2848002 RepID=A0A514K328_9VIRU|nr:hypothetical protein QIT55_gp51 [Nitrosopumilus spindle-shaped virus]QDI74037.1 hypothetical protein [Nitrosopumilus spindle-shaped virus]
MRIWETKRFWKISLTYKIEISKRVTSFEIHFSKNVTLMDLYPNLKRD